MVPNISDILSNPEGLKAFLKDTDVKKIITQLEKEDRSEKRAPKEGITVKDRYDRYEQFAGVVITVRHKKIQNGKMAVSIRADGRSPRDTHAAAEAEVLRLKRRYKIA